ALRAVESAREAAAAGSASDRAAHVGYHLVDRGRSLLETDVAYRPRPRTRLRRALLRHPAACYLAPIGLLTALLVGGGAGYERSAGGSTFMLIAVVLLLAIPASD